MILGWLEGNLNCLQEFVVKEVLSFNLFDPLYLFTVAHKQWCSYCIIEHTKEGGIDSLP